MKQARYLIEKYTDEYRTLYQAIMIDLNRDEESRGKESIYARSQINPNLKILLEQGYYDENMKLLERKKLINDNWYFEKIKDSD